MATTRTPQCTRLASGGPASLRSKGFAVVRILFALSAATMGVLLVVFATAPNVGTTAATLQLSIWPYFAGAAFLIAAVVVFLNAKVRLAATVFGTTVLLFSLVAWVPWLAEHPQDAAGGNCLRDMCLAGGALLLAGALPRRVE